MKSVIIHADGRRIDLADTVSPAEYAELENLRCRRENPVLRCGGCKGAIYIRHGSTRKNELFGTHFQVGTCRETLRIRKSVMSDEHKREAEYHVKAAERAGHSADLEVVTTGRTRVDVVVNGQIGFEIQRSALTKAAAVSRTARSVSGGLKAVSWFTDRSTSPQWAGHVPGYRTTIPAAAWQVLPLPGTVTAAGLQKFSAVRCGTRGLCPHGKGECPEFIPWLEPWTGLHVDDVVAGTAADLIRPVRVGKFVRLMSVDSIALHEELTGIALSYNAGPSRASLPPTDRVECELPPRVPAAIRDWFENGRANWLRQREVRREGQQWDLLLHDTRVFTAAEDGHAYRDIQEIQRHATAGRCCRCRRPGISNRLCDECDRAVDELIILARRRRRG